MALAGRCECGVSDELVAEEPDPHMACIGLKWCFRCGEVKRIGLRCLECARTYQRRYMRYYNLKSENRAKKRRQAAECERRSRRGSSPRYERQKAHKRWLYETDPAYRAACLERARKSAQRRAA